MTSLNLDAALAGLVAEGKNLPTAAANLLPDLTLYGFVTDVREHAEAVQMLAPTGAARASFANSRAALESCRDASFLTSDATQYEYRAAQARVAELREIDEMERRSAPHKPPLPTGAPARLYSVDVIAQDASDWNAAAPGKGTLLVRAWEAAERERGALRKHWSLLDADQVFDTVFRDQAEEATDLGDMASVIHALLSIHSHSRSRVGSRMIEQKDDGGIWLRSKPTDADMARQVAAFACRVATQALQRRRSFSL